MDQLIQFIRKINDGNRFKNDDQRKLIIILLVSSLILSLFEAVIVGQQYSGPNGNGPRYQLLLYGFSAFLVISIACAYYNMLLPGRLVSPLAGFVLITIFLSEQGLHDMSIGGYYLLLLITGLLLGDKGSLFLGILSTIAISIVGVVKREDINEVITAALFMLGTTLVLHYIVSRLHHEAESAHKNEQAQIAANESLSQLRAELEKRVEARTAELQAVNEEMTKQLGEISGLRSKLEEEAIRDPLTNLYNRRYLTETLVREFAHARREEYDISFMLLDIDHFKKFNDLYGHATGDLAIKTVAKHLTSRARAAGIACRMGGEEFLLVMPGILDEVAQLRAEYFRDQLMAVGIPFGEENLTITVSIGVASFPKNGETWEELYEAVDQALYRAKQNGRNRVECA